MSSGRRLLDQLDVIKSLANRSGIPHVLLGTYDLLAFRNLNGQLSRRSTDVHFGRYRAERANEAAIFLNVVRSFEAQLPIDKSIELTKDWEYLYERSIGCVGVLKEWLVRALSRALRRGQKALEREDLETCALSVSQCDKMLTECIEGGNANDRKQRGPLSLACSTGIEGSGGALCFAAGRAGRWALP